MKTMRRMPWLGLVGGLAMVGACTFDSQLGTADSSDSGETDAGGTDSGCTPGATRMADDGCNSCTCVNGLWVCTTKGCPATDGGSGGGGNGGQANAATNRDDLAACESLCARQDECGVGTYCENSSCASREECVVYCRADVADFNSVGTACADEIWQYLECMIVAPCSVLLATDRTAALKTVPGCAALLDEEAREDACRGP